MSTGDRLRVVASRRCPRCREGKLLRSWFGAYPGCSRCGLAFERAPGDQFGVMYLSTAVITVAFFALGVFVIGAMEVVEKVLFVLGGVALMVVTFPLRKSLAICVDYWIDQTQSSTGDD